MGSSSTSSFVAEAVWGETISVNATGTLTIQAVPPLNKDIPCSGAEQATYIPNLIDPRHMKVYTSATLPAPFDSPYSAEPCEMADAEDCPISFLA